MVKQVTVIECPHCQSQQVIRFGVNATGKQRYRCQECKKTFVQAPQKARQADRLSDPEFVSQALAAYQERASMRGVARTFKISRNTLARLLKKSKDTA